MCDRAIAVLDTLNDEVELVGERVVAIGDAYVGQVGALDVVALHALLLEVGAEPVLLDPGREAAHHNAVARYLAHVHRAHLPHLCGDAVLLHERLLGEVKLQRIVRGQAQIEADRVVLVERVLDVVEEHGVVAQRRHGYADLAQVEQVLKHGHFAQHKAVRYVVGEHEGGDEVVDGARFATVRPKVERVEAALASKVVQRHDVRVHVVYVVDIGRILVRRPILRQRRLHVEQLALGLGLVVHRIETGHLFFPRITNMTYLYLIDVEFIRLIYRIE